MVSNTAATELASIIEKVYQAVRSGDSEEWWSLRQKKKKNSYISLVQQAEMGLVG